MEKKICRQHSFAEQGAPSAVGTPAQELGLIFLLASMQRPAHCSFHSRDSFWHSRDDQCDKEGVSDRIRPGGPGCEQITILGPLSRYVAERGCFRPESFSNSDEVRS